MYADPQEYYYYLLSTLKSSGGGGDYEIEADYQFNSIVTTTDSSGNGLDLTNYGCTLTTDSAGTPDNAYLFTGASSNYMSVMLTGAGKLMFTDGAGNDTPFKVKLKVIVNSWNVSIYRDPCFFSKKEDYPLNFLGYTFTQLRNSTNLFFWVSSSATQRLGVQFDRGAIGLGNWKEIELQYDGLKTAGSFKVLVDGVEVTTSLYSIGAYTGLLEQNSQLFVGSDLPQGGQYPPFFDGKMEYLQFYKGI